VPTIGAVDVTPRQRKKLRKERDRELKSQARRKAGAVQRDQYLAESRNGAKPWEKAGMSRATWYRRLKEGRETSPSAVKLANRVDEPVSTEPSRPAVGRPGQGSDLGSGPVPISPPSVISLSARASLRVASLRAVPYQAGSTPWPDNLVEIAA
jgi:hypothetical protein